MAGLGGGVGLLAPVLIYGDTRPTQGLSRGPLVQEHLGETVISPPNIHEMSTNDIPNAVQKSRWEHVSSREV